MKAGMLPASPATGKVIIPRRVRRRHVQFAAATARRALATVRHTISKRLAATFGL